jgi:tetratricopeptide (TPR) repeat protein
MAAEPLKPIRSPGTLSVESPRLPLTPGPTLETTTLASLQKKLEDARGEYALRHYDAVVRILDELEMNVQSMIQASSSGEALPDQVLLKASLLCLKGRVLSAKRAEAEAREAFTESVRLFEDQKSEMERQNPTRMWTDYGMALSRLGRTQEAMDLLERVCASGAAPPEAFGYLGFGYQQRGALGNAEGAYRKGLQLSPSDPMLLRYLAETLDAAGKRVEAVAAYCDAAVAIADTDVETATQLAQGALRIDPTDVRALNTAINMELRRQHLDGALAIVDAALQCDPHHAWALGLKGSLLRISGDLNEAIKILRSVEVQSSELTWVLVELATTLHEFSSEQDTEALELLDRASTLNPQDAAAFYVEARIRLDRGEVSEAVAALDRAVEINPQSASLQCELGQALFRAGNFGRAQLAFDQALSLDPKSSVALASKADTLIEQWRVNEKEQRTNAALDQALDLRTNAPLNQALDLYRRALRVEPDNTFVFQALVDLLLYLGRIDEAYEELDHEIEQKPQNAWAHWRKGQILRNRKELKGAVGAFETAVSLEPNNPNMISDLAETLRALDDYSAAGEAYDNLLRVQPDDPNALSAKAWYLSDIASFDEASRLLDVAIKKAPNEPGLLGAQGWCLENLGGRSLERAREIYEQAVDLRRQRNEDDLWELKGLANTLSQLGAEEEAETRFKEIIARQKYKVGNDALILAALGWCHYRLGRYDEAVRLLHVSLSVNEDDPAAAFDLGLVLLASSRPSLAVSEYERGFDLTSKRHILRQRGLYYIALFDLVEGAKSHSFGSEADGIFRSLRARLRDSGVNIAELSAWLGDKLPRNRTSVSVPAKPV